MQVAQPEAESPHGEVTEASLAAREADGAASIVALYASLLTGLLVCAVHLTDILYSSSIMLIGSQQKGRVIPDASCTPDAARTARHCMASLTLPALTD